MDITVANTEYDNHESAILMFTIEMKNIRNMIIAPLKSQILHL